MDLSFVRGGSRIPRRRDKSSGCQQIILPNFPKKELHHGRTFFAVGGGMGGRGAGAAGGGEPMLPWPASLDAVLILEIIIFTQNPNVGYCM